MSPRRSNPWLKHATDFRNEPDNIDLVEKFGHAGYSIHVRTREIIGANIDEETAAARYPVTYWLQELRTKRGKLFEILDFLEEVGRITYEVDGNHLEITYPQLYALRSEYAQKRERKARKAKAAGDAKSPDKPPDKRSDTRRKEQSEKQTHKETASRSARSSRSRAARSG